MYHACAFPASGLEVKSPEMVNFLIVYLRQGFLLFTSENICGIWCWSPNICSPFFSNKSGFSPARAFPGSPAARGGSKLISDHSQKRSEKIPGWVLTDKAYACSFSFCLECGWGVGANACRMSFLGPQTRSCKQEKYILSQFRRLEV